MAFSAALALSDLNDFLGVSQECIKPVTVKDAPAEKEVGAAATEIVIDHASNAYYEVDGQGSSISTDSKKLQKAEITLNDCLACSGCVTSAESVLVAMQSHQEVYKVLHEQPDLAPVLSVAPQSVASLAALYSIPPAACLRKLRKAFREALGFQLVFDTTFARHMSLKEGQAELREKAPSLKGKEKASLAETAPFPLLASACPGWICYAEKTHGELLPFMSTVKSPQQVMGSLVKEWLAPSLGLSREQVYHVSVMPCYDKKLEASRPDFATPGGNRDVDCVLTTGEVVKIFNDKGIDLSTLQEEATDTEDTFLPSMLQQPGSASGGYLHNAITAAIRTQPPESMNSLTVEERIVRGEDYVEHLLRSGNKIIFRGAKCYGFRNLQNVVRKVGREAGVAVSKGAAGKAVSKRGGLMKRSARSSGISTPEEPDRGYDFIEVMACPSGCVNGGGQVNPPKHPMPVSVDREGMPIIADDAGEYKVVMDTSNGHRILSGKEWVARVEEFYWQFGAKKVQEFYSGAPHPSLWPYLGSDSRVKQYDDLAQQILTDIANRHPNIDQARQHVLRTQYRALESEEVNGLAVKW